MQSGPLVPQLFSVQATAVGFLTTKMSYGELQEQFGQESLDDASFFLPPHFGREVLHCSTTVSSILNQARRIAMKYQEHDQVTK